MKPAVNVGDCVIAERIDPAATPPEPGDIIVFHHPANGVPFIKRVVALAGQAVALENGHPVIDGAPARVAALPAHAQPFAAYPGGGRPACGEIDDGICRTSRFRETLANGAAYDVLDIGPSRLDNLPETRVPDAHVFVLGDHRDNSQDSRVPLSAGGIGPVPLEAIIGRVVKINGVAAFE